jgi:putative CocE/NonD family hydrolase
MSQIEFRDDEYGKSGLTYETVSPYGLKDEIEASNVLMQIWVSWLDAGTTEGALSRYLTFSNPQQVIIGAWSHGGGPNVDPFMPDPVPSDPSEAGYATFMAMKPQFEQVLDFFDCYLKDETCGELESSITYYTLNSGEWKTTKVWPPENVQNQIMYFASDNALVDDLPEEENASDQYAVDYTATTGTANRWFAQAGMPIDLAYDRAAEDEKLLTYTSEPMKADTEITGTPVLNMYLSSTTEDCAFHVYLEDVAPDGKVTYITEGLLRAIHHKVSEDTPPYEVVGPYHSYLREDAAPLVPGEVTEIYLALYPTSVLIEEGHSIRVAIAGADADTFNRYPAEETPVWDMQRNQMYPSSIELPIVQ